MKPVPMTATIEGKRLTMNRTQWAEYLNDKYDIPRGGFDWRFKSFNCDLQAMIDSVSPPENQWKARNYFLYGVCC